MAEDTAGTRLWELSASEGASSVRRKHRPRMRQGWDHKSPWLTSEIAFCTFIWNQPALHSGSLF